MNQVQVADPAAPWPYDQTVAADFLHFDLKQCRRGDTVEVTLDRGANVRVLDASNLRKYKRGEKHTFYGGLAKKSPARIAIPRTGHWYAVIDMQGLKPARIKASVRTISAESQRPLPPLREPRSDLAEIAEVLAHDAPSQTVVYDVFVSHASEDKDDVVRPLAAALSERGLKVWFDEATLRIGDSLRRGIDAGIANSRFGIVVLSPQFLSKGWTQYELDGLVTMSVSGKQGLLPLWRGVSKDQVIAHSPSLADKVALNTATSTIAEIADEISAVVLESK